MLPYAVPLSQELHWFLGILLEVLHTIIYVKLGDASVITVFESTYV